MSTAPATRWWDVWVTPRGVLLFGLLVAFLTGVVLLLCDWGPRQPQRGMPWAALILLVPLLATPAALCAAGLRMAREHPLLPWVNGQVRIVLACGFAVLLADVIALIALAMLPDLGAAVFLLYMTCGQLIFVGLCLLGVQSLVYLLRWHWGERPDGWRDPE